MMRKKWLVLLGIGLLLLPIGPSLADKRIGVSPPNYDYVPVTPNSTFSGGFTVFNQGDEDLRAYAEVHNAPGNVTIEWQNEETKNWVDSPEVLIPAKEHRYGRFIILLGELTQGQFYNWSIVSGYVETDPKVSVVAQAGFRINMIYPFPPPEPPKWYEHTWLQFLLLAIGASAVCTTLIIRKVQEYNRRDPLYVPRN